MTDKDRPKDWWGFDQLVPWLLFMMPSMQVFETYEARSAVQIRDLKITISVGWSLRVAGCGGDLLVDRERYSLFGDWRKRLGKPLRLCACRDPQLHPLRRYPGVLDVSMAVSRSG